MKEIKAKKDKDEKMKFIFLRPSETIRKRIKQAQGE